jgi:hypothetical protein
VLAELTIFADQSLKHITMLVGILFFATPLLAETPCDFKGVSVGSRMSPAEIMSALGVSQYKTNPDQSGDWALAQKYGMMAAGEIADWNIGPFCNDSKCNVPYGISVGLADSISVWVIVSFHDGQIIEIVVKFAYEAWDEVMPIIDQKYGDNWKVERGMTGVTNLEDKKTLIVPLIHKEHITNGINPSTKDRCKIWATNIDMVFEHHDAFGPYHSEFVIHLISKNF